LQRRLPPYPRRSVLVSKASLNPLVTEALLRTGDRIAADLPVDGARSLKALVMVKRFAKAVQAGKVSG